DLAVDSLNAKVNHERTHPNCITRSVGGISLVNGPAVRSSLEGGYGQDGASVIALRLNPGDRYRHVIAVAKRSARAGFDQAEIRRRKRSRGHRLRERNLQRRLPLEGGPPVGRAGAFDRRRSRVLEQANR